MQELNLKERAEERSPITIKLYGSDIEKMRSLSASSGVSVQNLVRHAVNDMLDKLYEEKV